ncbi:hypothetical protein SDRG_06131 [Saprolegnia diclina VS20]|uniref:Helicase-associated domain-containing protein n=1 Tax=Saprolegnia diclina (strain VS20) TaxID=1156394 RepID=T0S1U8_SAPDV|nr:hypothetical protein SDRG_06131 [Saprolegnia diclina VS20]EQC36697.1 hypothetical protein SDRG_06131 [Saprolegnia diclina VS20]|eukprot:XP_008610118.1 hypothetical protein SDRG_06131 [Saprolegnia diclina VS20]
MLLRHLQRATFATKRLPLEKQRAFVDVVRVFRDLQAPTSDYTLLPAVFRVPDAAPWPPAAWSTTVSVYHVRAAYEQGTLAPEIIDELKQLRFVWRQREHVWERNLEALEAYKARFGSLHIVPSFTIAADDTSWPKDLRGLQLGMVVYSFRRLAQQGALPIAKRRVLDAMGFVWHVRVWQWEKKLLALATYRKIYGNLHVPRDFVVPVHDGWPPEIWQLRLGDAVATFRHHADALPSERMDALNALDFVWDMNEAEWDRKLRALTTYKALYGHVDVPQGFLVPEDDLEWPRDVWEMELGHVVANLRASETLSDERRAALNALGFAWQYFEAEWARKLQALAHYKALYGTTNVPTTFTVPQNDKRWPDRLWWMPLGLIVQRLRAQRHDGLTDARRADLDRLGFAWTRNKQTS